MQIAAKHSSSPQLAAVASPGQPSVTSSAIKGVFAEDNWYAPLIGPVGIVAIAVFVVIAARLLTGTLRPKNQLTLEEYRPIALTGLLSLLGLAVGAFLIRLLSPALHDRVDQWGILYLGMAGVILVLPFLKSLAFKDVNAGFEPILIAKSFVQAETAIGQKLENITATMDGASAVVADSESADALDVPEVEESAAIESRELEELRPLPRRDFDSLSVDDRLFFIALSSEIERRLEHLFKAAGLDVPVHSGARELLRKLEILGILDKPEVEPLERIVETGEQQQRGDVLDRETIRLGRSQAIRLLRSLDTLVYYARYWRVREQLATQARRSGKSAARDAELQRRTGRIEAADLVIDGDIIAEVRITQKRVLQIVTGAINELRGFAEIRRREPRLLIAVEAKPSIKEWRDAVARADMEKVPLVWLHSDDSFGGTQLAHEAYPWLFAGEAVN